MDKETEKVVLNLRWTLAACRVNKNLTQEEAAEKLHMSPATLTNHELGKVKPSYVQLLAYANLYEVPVETIDSEVRD